MGRSVRILLAAAIVLSLLIIGVLPAAAAGSVLYVDDDPGCGGLDPCYAAIQAAVNAAADGDTVQVLPGTYIEQILIAGKSISLLGTDNPVVQAPAVRTTVQIPEASGVVFEPILTAYGDLSGTSTISLTVSGLTFDGQNSATVNRLAGMLLRNVNPGDITGNIVRNLGASSDNPQTVGIVAYGDSDVDISGNDVSGYTRLGIGLLGDVLDLGWPDAPPALGTLHDPTGAIFGNVVTGNGAGGGWAENGIQVSYGASATVESNTISNNYWPGAWSAGVSSGIIIYGTDGAAVVIRNNTLAGNGQFGISLTYVYSAGTEVRDNTVTGSGWAVSVEHATSSVAVTGNTIAALTPDTSYNGIWAGEAIVNIADNTVTGGYAAIGVSAGVTGTIHDNTVSGYMKRGIQAGDVNANNSGLNVTISGNTVNGGGDSTEIARNGIQVEVGAIATVTGNEVFGHSYVGGTAGLGLCNGQGDKGDKAYFIACDVATGILVWEGSATVSGNSIHDNQLGFAGVGASLSATLDHNSIYDNFVYGAVTQPLDNGYDPDFGPALNAENNWWGSDSGPLAAGNPSGMGDAVSLNVDYNPWTNESGTAGYLLGGAVAVSPATSVVNTGDTFTVAVGTSGIAGISGFELGMHYDDAVLELQSVAHGTRFDWTGGWLSSDNASASGIISWDATLPMGAAAPAGDSGSLIVFTFKAVAPATSSAVVIDSVLLTDVDGVSLLPANVSNGTVTVTGLPVITGTVRLQGRANATQKYAGTVVSLGSGLTATTNSEGAFAITAAISSYTATMAHESYLGTTGQVTSASVHEQYLLFGDINNDGVINIQDLAFIAYRFDPQSGAPNYDIRGDMNLDGRINIYDLTGAAGNYGATQSDWRS